MNKEWEYYFLYFLRNQSSEVCPQVSTSQILQNTKIHELLQSPLGSQAWDH